MKIDDCDYEYDYNDSSLFDYYNTCIYRDGYTKEEFEFMDHMQSLLYEDFTGCNIESYILNLTGDDKQKVRVYVSKCEDGSFEIN